MIRGVRVRGPRLVRVPQLRPTQQLDAVANVLGHESVETTRKHYAFASDERRRATIEAFDV